ncbi:MAG: ABC transporter substrate-binding protein, partial [Armatimonadota bacterium]
AVGEFWFRGSASAQAQPIKIGAPLPLTGPSAPLGQHSLWGTQAALKVIERGGGIAGRPVQLLVEDDGGRAADGVRIARKMILEDRVDALIAGATSVDAIPMVNVAKELETLFLVTVAESDLITADFCNKYTFRLTPDARAKARAGAPFLVKNVAQKWQFMYWDNAFGQSMLKWFTEEFRKQGGDIVEAIPTLAGTTDFSPYLARLRPPSVAPAIFHAVAGTDVIRLSKQLGEFGTLKQYKLAGTCDVILPETFNDQARDLDGAYIIEQYMVKNVSPLNSEADAAFRRVFQEVSKGILPGPHSYSAYESTFIYKKALEAAGYRDKRDTPKLIPAIEGMRGQKSVEFPQGPFVMRKDDHQGLLNLYIWQLKNGQADVKAVVSSGGSYYAPADTCRL